MAKKDLIEEAQKLGLNVNTKDTVAVICQKIKEAALESEYCKKTPRRGRPSKPKASPKTKASPRTKDSPKNEICINIENDDYENLKLTFNSKRAVSITDIHKLLDYFKDIKEDFILKENGVDVKKNDLRGGSYTFGRENLTKNIKINKTGINEYNKHENLNFLGLNEFKLVSKGPGGNYTKEYYFVFNSSSQYYILKITLKVPSYFDHTNKNGVNTKKPLLITSEFNLSTKDKCESLLSDKDPFTKIFKNNMKKKIIFKGKNKNVIINKIVDNSENVIILPSFIKLK